MGLTTLKCTKVNRRLPVTRSVRRGGKVFFNPPSPLINPPPQQAQDVKRRAVFWSSSGSYSTVYILLLRDLKYEYVAARNPRDGVREIREFIVIY